MSGPLPRAVRIAAPSKINPWLEVLGARPDGFHELDTLLVTLDLVDELEVRRADEAASAGGEALTLRVEELAAGAAAGCPDDRHNLVWRAAEAVLELAHARGLATPPLALTLGKRIPSAAGLGGGSADAAAAVLGAALVLGLDPAEPALLDILARLGSDCAFFLAARAQGAARCGGRGERVEPLALPADLPAVALVTPSTRVATADVYGALGAGPLEPAAKVASLRALLGLEARPFCRLESAALAVAPELRTWRQMLDAATQATRPERAERPWGDFTLSGSGSSFFAFAPNAPLAERLLDAVRSAAKARDHGLRLARTCSLRGLGVSLRARM